MLIFLGLVGIFGGEGFGREGGLCDLIDWDFGFLFLLLGA